MKVKDDFDDETQWQKMGFGGLYVSTPLANELRDEAQQKREEDARERTRVAEQESAKEKAGHRDDSGSAELGDEVGATVKTLVQAQGVRVFSEPALRELKRYFHDLSDEDQKRFKRMIDATGRYEGYRHLPSLDKAPNCLEQMAGQFENLTEVIRRISVELTIASAMPPANFRVAPVLMVGDPGLGKTYFAQSLAQRIGTHSAKISAGGVQGNFVLSGTSSHWSNAYPGKIFKLLAEGDSAAPILIIDEVDKLGGGDNRYPVLPILLDLLEPCTAKEFTDECLHVKFDASKIIILLTANCLELVPEPLLSRVEVVQVPRPEPQQRLRIIQHEFAELRKKTGRRITLDQSTAVQLAERVDIDLRKTTRIVKDAFGDALSNKAKVAVLKIPRVVRRPMGFL